LQVCHGTGHVSTILSTVKKNNLSAGVMVEDQKRMEQEQNYSKTPLHFVVHEVNYFKFIRFLHKYFFVRYIMQV